MRIQSILSTAVTAAVFTVLSGAGVASAATSVVDSYEQPTDIRNTYFSTNPNTNNGTTSVTDSQGRQYRGYAGLGGAGHFGGAPRTGDQFLFIESFQGVNASVSQTYALDPGEYTLSYYEGGRGELGGQYGSFTYDLVVDDVVRGSYTTDNLGGVPDDLRTVPSFTVGAGGTTTITFQGTGNQSDNMGFFDDLTITPVPEPTGLALMGLGGGLLLARRRRGR